MTRQDHLLEWLKQVNPVPNPSLLYEDVETSRRPSLSDQQKRGKTMTTTKIDQLTPGPRGPRIRRGLVIGAAAVALAVVVGVAFAFVIADGEDAADGGPASLATTTATTVITPRALLTVEALFDAREQGDVDAFIALHSPEAIEGLGNRIVDVGERADLSYEEAEQVVRDDFMFWYLIGTEWALSDCEVTAREAGPEDLVDCQLAADTGFLRASGEATEPLQVRWTVEDGIITQDPHALIRNYDESIAQASFFDWVDERLADGTIGEGTVPCDTDLGYVPPMKGGTQAGQIPTAQCAQWVADHLDQWAADLATAPDTSG